MNWTAIDVPAPFLVLGVLTFYIAKGYNVDKQWQSLQNLKEKNSKV